MSPLGRLLGATLAFMCVWLIAAVALAMRSPDWTLFVAGALLVASIILIIITLQAWTQEADAAQRRPGRGGDYGGGGPGWRWPDAPQPGGGGSDPGWWPDFERQLAPVRGRTSKREPDALPVLIPMSPCFTDPPWTNVPGLNGRTGQPAPDIDVLVVDDHPRVRSAIEALLTHAQGLRVVDAVSSGAAAIEVAARLLPAVVVMDLAMPDINGVAATREICRREAAPAVVAFSGSRELWREARAAGAAFAILKDEDPNTLLEAIRTAARR